MVRWDRINARPTGCDTIIRKLVQLPQSLAAEAWWGDPVLVLTVRWRPNECGRDPSSMDTHLLEAGRGPPTEFNELPVSP